MPRPSNQKHSFKNYSKSRSYNHGVLPKITSGREVSEPDGRHGHYDIINSFEDAAEGRNIEFELNLIAQEQE